MALLRAGPILAVLVLGLAPAAAQQIDYVSLYERGVSFAAFLDKAESRREEWKANYKNALPDSEAVVKVRGIEGRRRILAVTIASCSDSVNTMPYLAKLVEAVPDHLELRTIDPEVGRPVMEAHRTPDGRAATPTVVILDERGRFLSAWSERPSELQTWYIQEGKSLERQQFINRKAKWYADDRGRSTVKEIVALLTR
jgi:hypothetical protein